MNCFGFNRLCYHKSQVVEQTNIGNDAKNESEVDDINGTSGTENGKDTGEKNTEKIENPTVPFNINSSLVRNGNNIFRSHHFSDERILFQLCDCDFQTKLCDHNWQELERMGPCFWTLAESILEGKMIKEALNDQSNLISPEVSEMLETNANFLFEAMREIAESYLSRGIQNAQNKDGVKEEDWSVPPKVVLRGTKGKLFRPVDFIASGSAGAVYSAERVEEDTTEFPNVVLETMKNAKIRGLVKEQMKRQMALKRIRPTQKNSAENEYRIADILAENDEHFHCVTYLDKAKESNDLLWLLLRRIYPGPYGVDLQEYIEAQAFNKDQDLARKVVLALLKGVVYISKCGIIIRDVKPDNVLMEYYKNLDGVETVLPRWTDFGLSIDLDRNLDGSGIRCPNATTTGKELKDALVDWGYDTQKLVPKPMWKHRRPPERCY